MRGRLGVVLCLLAMTALARATPEGDAAEAKRLYQEGTASYNLGDFGDAVAKYKAGYKGSWIRVMTGQSQIASSVPSELAVACPSDGGAINGSFGFEVRSSIGTVFAIDAQFFSGPAPLTYCGTPCPGMVGCAHVVTVGQAIGSGWIAGIFEPSVSSAAPSVAFMSISPISDADLQ
jgi:hypothetical protein